METLLEKLLKVDETTKKILADNPNVTGIWYHFDDVPLNELRDAGVHYKVPPEFSKPNNKMCVQLSYQIPNSTVFCYSKEVKVTEHIVIDEAYENI